MTLTERREVAEHVLGHAIGWNIAIGAGLVLLGAVALQRLIDCARWPGTQPSGCMRITARELGTVCASWGVAVRAGLDARGIRIASVCVTLNVSRQYVERLLAGQVPTIPVEHFLALTLIAGVDLAPHVRLNPEITPWQNHRSPTTSPNSDPA
jgi:hypothetical protein